MHVEDMFLKVEAEISSVRAIRTSKRLVTRVDDGVPPAVLASFKGFATYSTGEKFHAVFHACLLDRTVLNHHKSGGCGVIG